MDWISMTVRTTTEGAEAVSAMFMELGIMGAMIEDKADVAVNQRPSGFWTSSATRSPRAWRTTSR